VLAVSFVVLAALSHPARATLAQLPIFLAFAQNQFTATHGHLDPPMWSLTVEVSFYAVLPLVALVAARLATNRAAQLGLCVLLALVGLGFCFLADHEAWGVTVTDSLLTMLPVFACGMAVAVLAHRRTIRARTGWLLIGAATPLMVLGGLLEIHSYPDNTAMRTALVDVPASIGFALVVGALVASPIRARALDNAPMRELGTLSYGMYLWHFPLIYGLRAAHLWPHELVPAMAITLAGATGLAAVSWYGLERPVVRWAHRSTTSELPGELIDRPAPAPRAAPASRSAAG
jgi:peptidoglycan/LPS O-acetylase OafA/YrhL